MKIERPLRKALTATILSILFDSANSEQLLISADTSISRGILSEKYWVSQALSDNDEALIAYADFSRRFEFKILSNDFFVESHTVASMSTTANSLVMFSKDDASIRRLPDLQTKLAGKLLSYGYDAFGINIKSASQNSNFTWLFSPKILRMTNFKSDSGSGIFSKQTDYYHLAAETNSIGYWEYGFFENPPGTVKFGSGITSDFSIKYQQSHLSAQLNVLNIYSRVSNYGLFYNSKRYQTKTKDTVILSNNFPAMAGEYGQSDFISSLPVFSTLKLEYADPHHKFRGAVGLDTLDGTSAGWGALTVQYDDLQMSAKSYGLKKMALDGQVTNLWLRGLSFGVGLESDFKGDWQFNALRVALEF